MRNNTKAMRMNTRAKLSWYRCAWRPVFQIFPNLVCVKGLALLGKFGGVRSNLFFASFLYYFYKNQIRFRQYRLWIWAAFLSVSFYIMASGILLVAQRFSAYFGAIIPLALAVLMIRQSARNDRFFLVVFVCLLNFISLFYFNDFVRLDYKP